MEQFNEQDEVLDDVEDKLDNLTSSRAFGIAVDEHMRSKFL